MRDGRRVLALGVGMTLTGLIYLGASYRSQLGADCYRGGLNQPYAAGLGTVLGVGGVLTLTGAILVARRRNPGDHLSRRQRIRLALATFGLSLASVGLMTAMSFGGIIICED